MCYLHSISYFSEATGKHHDNLIHRDLKTSNVFLMKDFTAKLADFGSTKALESTDMTITGTPIYMAPEVVRGEAYVGERAKRAGLRPPENTNEERSDE